MYIVHREADQFRKQVRGHLQSEHVDEIQSWLDDQDLQWLQSKTGDSNKTSKHRSSKHAWVRDDEFVQFVASQFHSANAKETEWQFDLGQVEEVQYTKYSTGDYFSWHSDSYTTNDFPPSIRKLSMTLMLSDSSEYEGGDLEFQHVVNGEFHTQTVKLERGDILIFPSMVSHRVTEITSGNRNVLVAWAWGPPYK